MGLPIGGVVTLTGTPQDLRTGVFGTSTTLEPLVSLCHSLVLRAGTTNSGNIFIGGTNVSTDGSNAYTVITPDGEGISFDLSSGDFVDVRNLYAVSSATTAEDKLYVFGIQ